MICAETALCFMTKCLRVSAERVLVSASGATTGARNGPLMNDETGVDSPRLEYSSPVRGPEFFLVGHPKCGTTALYEMLRRHPAICIPIKEPGYFSQEYRPRFIPRPQDQPTTLSEYLALFQLCKGEQVAGEATPWYLRSEVAAAAIAEYNPAARIIAVFREPVSFLQSFHLHQFKWGVENVRDFERAISLESARREGRHIPHGCKNPRELWYTDLVKYTSQLRRFRAVFPDEQITVLLHEEFRRENERTVRSVFRFLGVDDSVPIPDIEANLTRGVRSRAMHHAIYLTFAGQGRIARSTRSILRATTTKSGRQRLLRFLESSLTYTRRPAEDPAFLGRLRVQCKPEVELFGEYLGRDLVSLWGYDRI